MIAAAALVGWVFGITPLTRILADLNTMKFNAAVAIVLIAIGVAPINWRNPPRFVVICGSLAALIGGLTLAQYLLGISFNIDQLVVADHITSPEHHPGRMAPATGVALLSLGSATTLLRLNWLPRSALAAHLVVLPASAVGFISLLGYLGNIEELYSFGIFMTVALGTAICLSALSIVVLVTRADESWLRRYRNQPLSRSFQLQFSVMALATPFVITLFIIHGFHLEYYSLSFGPVLFSAMASAAFLWMADRAARLLSRAEKASQESVALLRAMGESSPDPIYAKSLDGRMLYANATTLAVIGKPAEAVMGRDAHDLFDNPSEARAILENDRHVMATGKSQTFIERVLKPDGTQGIYRSTKAPMLDHTGALIGLVGVTTDVTVETAAQSRLAFMAALVDQLHSTAGDRIELACGLLGRQLGASRVGFGEALEGGAIFTIDHEYSDGTVNSARGQHRLSDFGAEIEQLLRGGQMVVVEDVVTDPRTSASSAAYLAFGIQSMVNVPLLRNGTLVAIFAINHRTSRHWLKDELQLVSEVAEKIWPIANEMRSQADLRASEQRFRTVIECLPSSIFVSDAAGNTTFTNTAFQRITGLSADELLGFNAEKVIYPDDAERIMKVWTEALQAGVPLEAEFRFNTADGGYCWHLGRAVPLRAEDGTILNWFGSFIDIQEIVDARETLARSRDELEALVAERTEEVVQLQKVESIGQLTGVSHTTSITC